LRGRVGGRDSVARIERGEIRDSVYQPATPHSDLAGLDPGYKSDFNAATNPA
jgi:hypothetical protein